MPKSALEDTQVLHGGTIDPFGVVQNSIWLLRAGARGLGVEVQVRKGSTGIVVHLIYNLRCDPEQYIVCARVRLT